MARHKLTLAQRLKGARALVKSPKVKAGLKKWAREFIRKNSVWIVAVLLLPGFASAQRNNVRHANQFGGSTVAAKVTAAQNSCASDTSVPCIIEIDTDLAAFATGSLPAPCTQCLWRDYRTPGDVKFADAVNTTLTSLARGATLATPITVANGGTALSSIGDDNIPVGSAATTYQAKALPNCVGSPNALNYTTATNTFSCASIASGTDVSGNIFGVCTGTATSSGTMSFLGWGAIISNACTSAYNTGNEFPQSAGTWKNLRFKCTTGGVNASSGVVTVTKNTVNTSITCTAGVSGVCTDLVNTMTTVSGDTLGVKFSTQAAETLNSCGFSLDRQ